MNNIGSYWSWLCGYTVDDDHIDGYSSLLGILFDTEFVSIMKGDEARAHDGIDLRDQFCNENGLDPERFYDEIGACSLLEMLIGLAVRIENDITCDPRNNKFNPQFWFWFMLHNIGLDDMDDENFDYDEVEYMINVFMNREFAPNGSGSLFTTDSNDLDFRTKPIWSQLCIFFNEHQELLG